MYCICETSSHFLFHCLALSRSCSLTLFFTPGLPTCLLKQCSFLKCFSFRKHSFRNEKLNYVKTLLKIFSLLLILWKFPNIASRVLIFERKFDFPGCSPDHSPTLILILIVMLSSLLSHLPLGLITSRLWLFLHIRISHSLLLIL